MVVFDRENVGWKMVYNFLGIDEKTKRNLTFVQNICEVYLNIRSVYPNKIHVTTHPVILRRDVEVSNGAKIKTSFWNSTTRTQYTRTGNGTNASKYAKISIKIGSHVHYSLLKNG